MAAQFLSTALVFSILGYSALAIPLANPGPPSNSPSKSVSNSPSNSASNSASSSSCSYTIKAANGSTVNFANHVSYDFTSLKSIPSWFTVNDNLTYTSVSPYCSRRFDSSNVALDRTGLKLTVPGGQTCTGSQVIGGAEIVSNVNDIFYASVRTVAEVSSVSGTINAAFFYADDYNEIDFEVQTANYKNVQLTNQAHQNAADSTYSMANTASFPSLTYHEYRYDWYPGVNGAANVTFFLDGKFMKSITANTPVNPGSLMWNNWSNGGSWTLGPPASNNVFRISSIEAFYNRTSGGTTCPVSTTSSTSKKLPGSNH